MTKYSTYNIASEYPFETQLERLIMIKILISGSGDGGNEKQIYDDEMLKFCCCSSSDLITSITSLVENGFIAKRNFGFQSGKPLSGYTITVPDWMKE